MKISTLAALGAVFLLAPASAICAPAAAAAPSATSQAPGGEAAKARFGELDANRDGALSNQEFLGPRWAAWGRHAAGEAMDPAACEAAEESDRKYRGEAPGGVPSSMLCAMLGAKGGGSIGWTDFASPSWEFFKMADRDGDGSISWAEYQAVDRLPQRAAPMPNPSEAVKARIAKDLAGSNASVKAPFGPALSTSTIRPSAPAEPPAERSRLDAIAEQVGSWLR
jgi:hypothetical protein